LGFLLVVLIQPKTSQNKLNGNVNVNANVNVKDKDKDKGNENFKANENNFSQSFTFFGEL